MGWEGMNAVDEGLDDCEVVELQQRGRRGQPGLCDAALTDDCQDFTRIFGLLSIFFNYRRGQMSARVRGSTLTPPPF